MTLQRFLAYAFLIFLLGIAVLYAGINRVPFRQDSHHGMHHACQPAGTDITGSPDGCSVPPGSGS